MERKDENLNEGYIKIGGVSIDGVGLHDIRDQMAVIPQDSFVFSGTLRENVDPMSELSSKRILDILEQIGFANTLRLEKIEQKSKDIANFLHTKNIQMDQFQTQETNHLKKEKRQEIKADRKLLKYKIEDGGKNLSLGQKQLICIARALAKNPKILLMDEATSNIDEFTDNLIQNIIKDRFKEKTISKYFLLY